MVSSSRFRVLVLCAELVIKSTINTAALHIRATGCNIYGLTSLSLCLSHY